MFGISVDRSDRVFDNFLSISERKHSSDSAALADLRKLRGIKGRRLRRACCDEAYNAYESSGEADVMTFLEWLLEHADEIFALITRIIALFQ